MARILLVFGTVEGQTKKIAQAVALELKKMGHVVDLKSSLGRPVADLLGRYEGVIVGAPVHYSGFPASIRKWVRTRADELSKRPSAFFSVCLGILQKDDAKAQNEERKVVQDLFQSSGWHPPQWTIFAGALPYSKYGLIKRLVMKAISRRAGGDTDTSRDYEYTDWNEVRRFAQSFDKQLGVIKPQKKLKRSA